MMIKDKKIKGTIRRQRTRIQKNRKEKEKKDIKEKNE